jgi:hypothetical protein
MLSAIRHIGMTSLIGTEERRQGDLERHSWGENRRSRAQRIADIQSAHTLYSPGQLIRPRCHSVRTRKVRSRLPSHQPTDVR